MDNIQMFKCKTCGSLLEDELAKSENGLVQCPYCLNIWTVPKKEVTPAALNFLRQGRYNLDICQFDNAYMAFAKAAEYDESEPEAYWGMALAEARVQYIKDIVNNKVQPICHEISQKKFTNDKNYKRALELATPEQKAEYISKAHEIDYISDEFYKLQKIGRNYDCFICVKVTDDQTKLRTADYKIADDLYFHLRGKGYEPFFSEREISDAVGADYEARILYALYCSECMLVICSDEAYLRTKWVQNEYTRFIELINGGKKDSDGITVLFSGSPIEKLPGREGRIQGIDLHGIDSIERIVAFVEAHTPRARAQREEAARKNKEQEEEILRQIEEQKLAFEKQQREMEDRLKQVQNAAAVNTAPASTVAGASVNSLLIRAEQELEDSQFKSAGSFYNRVLEADPQNAHAWWGLLLTELGTAALSESASRETIQNYINGCGIEDIRKIMQDRNYKNAMRYADGEQRTHIENVKQEFTNHGKELERIEAERRAQREAAARKAQEEAERRRQAEEIRKAQEEERRRQAEERKIAEDFDIEDTVLKKYKSKDMKVFIPDRVTSIGASAFEGCSRLTSITIPNNVKFIDRCAFKGCSNLTSITIPDSVTSIGNSAFEGCSNLTSITIPNNVMSIGSYAFDGCRNLTSVVMPDNVISIGRHAFDGCRNLIYNKKDNAKYLGNNNYPYLCLMDKSSTGITRVTIDENCKIIYNCAFRWCHCLKSVTIPNSVVYIGDNAFEGCDSLINITIPNSVKFIGDEMFSMCYNLTSVTIPESVTSIGSYAFAHCIRLKKIKIPVSVKSIAYDAFDECMKLKIYCKVDKKPDGWDKAWNVKKKGLIFKKRCKTIWGYKK